MPSACGGKGTCAYCKVKVLEGAGAVLATETPYLDESEIKNHVRLACQVKVRNDIKIEISEDLFLIREFQVQVKSISDVTPFIKKVTLSILSPEEGITFKPGQYIQLEVPRYKLSKTAEYRAFSMASSPKTPHIIVLYIGRAEKGVVSTYVHDYLKEGDAMIIRGPFGDFYYRDSERSMLLIATGTGLAPLISILRHTVEEDIQRKATLFFGTRTPKDLYCLDELRDLEKKWPSFTFIPVLSRVTKDMNWDGEQGRVTSLIEKTIPDGTDIDAYICGNPAMVESCLSLLAKKSIPQSQIYFDKFE